MTLKQEFLIKLYHDLIQSRLIEEKMLLLLRKGKISKWFSGIGQEAISVGATNALLAEEYIFPMHRNLGVYTARKVSLTKLFRQWQGDADGFTKGRDRSFHFGTHDYNIVGMISHLGPQLSVASGVALAEKLKASNQLSLAFTGEGGTSQGEFHEALNVASVWKLPVIFIIENNGYGLSTPTREQYACKKLSDRKIAYGMPGETIDGNDIVSVFNCVDKWAKKIRKNPQPVLIECETFRIRGHEEASGTAYVPDELIAAWKKKDPIKKFEAYLVKEKVLNKKKIAEIQKYISDEIDQAVEEVYERNQAEKNEVSTEQEINDVFLVDERNSIKPSETKRELRFVDAISEALDQALQTHPNLILLGQDIAEYGGVFKITKDFINKYGAEKIRNTPLCESAILGITMGLSISGYKSVVEMQFADFVSCGMTQIANWFAKSYYRWGQNADVVVRLPCGAGVGAGPFHSQTMEAWFTQIAGLKVVYPAFPEDAKGLLLSAIEDPNPVMFFEHKKLYRSISGQVPDAYYNLPLGKAAIVIEGTQASIITYGMGVHWALEAVKETDLDCEIIDLRTLSPLDWTAIEKSIEKTGRALVLHEASLTGGFGGEIAALIAERCFEFLDAPVMRCGSLDTPIPFAKNLEENYLANSQLAQKLKVLLNY